jgi:hypothetical protein
MAERLPRYRRIGVSPTAVPSVSTRGLNYRMPQMQIRDEFEGVRNALDRMTTFAFKEAAERAKIEGAEYGAENAPTAAQIRDSVAVGEEIQVIGDRDTIFGNAARSAALSAINNEIELLGRQEISNLQLAVEEGRMTPGDFQTRVNASIEGYASSLSGYSTADARKMRAGLATIGNTAFVSASRKYEARLKQQREVKAFELARQLLDEIPDVMDTGDTRARNGDVITYNDKIEATRRKGFHLYMALGDPEGYKAFSDNLNKRVLASKKDAVEAWARNPETPDEQILRFILEGRLPEGSKLDRFYNDSNPKDRTELRKIAESANAAAVKLEESAQVQAIQAKTRGQQTRESAMISDFFKNKNNYSETLLSDMRRGQEISKLFYQFAEKEKSRTQDATTNINVLSEISDNIVNGIDQHDDLLRARINDQLSEEDFKLLVLENQRMLNATPRYGQEEEKEEWEYVKGQISGGAIGGITILNMNDEQRAKINRRVAAAQREYRSRVRNGEIPKQVANDIVMRYRSNIPAPVNSFNPQSPSDLELLIQENETKYNNGKRATSKYKQNNKELVEWLNYFTITAPIKEAK